jgi:fructuronate reductase
MRLSRSQLGLATPVANMIHIGIGAFFRAHQAWYTHVAEPEGNWGYVAFTGRSSEVADQLAPQNGLYTLVTRGADGDSFEVINSLARVEDGSDLQRLTSAVVYPDTALVTLTITEAGYCLNPDGTLLDGPALIESLKNGSPTNALTRLAWVLNQRRLSNGKGLALVPCDNIPANGRLLRGAMEQLFDAFDDDARSWLAENISFVSTSIDRITPKTTDADLATVEAGIGFEDASPVVTEPFRDWVLEGPFPLGRPAWERAGAKFVDHIEPFENRKLWLLNGSHSLLAYLGQLRGHATVDQAIADPVCLDAVKDFWDEAERTLDNPDLGIAEYRRALLERYRNPRIAHQLSQIAIDGATKVRVRIIPTLRAELGAGRSADGAIGVVASWIAFVLDTPELKDARRADIDSARAGGDPSKVIPALLAILDGELANNSKLVAAISDRVAKLRNQEKEN